MGVAVNTNTGEVIEGVVTSVNGETGDVTVAAGSGDVAGPGSSTNAHIATFNGTDGKTIQDSGTKLSDLANASHSHAESDVTNLTTDLAGKASSTHSHAESDVTSLVSDLAGKAASSHTHAEGDLTTTDITTNNVTTSKHGFITKAPNDTTKFFRGDASWAVPTASLPNKLNLPFLNTATNLKMFSVYGAGISGDTTMYTVPAGKTACILLMGAYNISGGALTWLPKVTLTSNSVTYPLAAAVSLNNNQQGTNSTTLWLNAGDLIKITCNGTNINLFAQIIEFDTSGSNVTVFQVHTLSSGAGTTIYTCPSVKNAWVYHPLNTSGSAQLPWNAYMINNNAGSINFRLDAVKSGGSGGNNPYLQKGPTAVGNAGIGQFATPQILNPSDFYWLYSDFTVTTGKMFVNFAVIEVAQ